MYGAPNGLSNAIIVRHKRTNARTNASMPGHTDAPTQVYIFFASNYQEESESTWLDWDYTMLRSITNMP